MKNKSIFDNKLFKILLSVVLSFIIWLYVITVVSPGSEITIYNIPVDLYGQSVLENDNKLMLAEDYHFTVDLRLAGNRTDLNQLNNANIKLSADLTNIMEAAENQPLSIRVDSFGDIPVSSITVLKKSKDTVNVTVVPRKEKTLTVEAEFNGTATPENFDKGTVSFDYPQITVYGPGELVDQVSRAVVNIDLTGRTETFTLKQPVQLQNAQKEPIVNDRIGNEEGIEEITATVPVLMYKELPLHIALQEGGGAAEENVQVEYFYTVGQEQRPITSVGVWGPKSQLDQLENIKLDTVDLSQIIGEETRVYDIELADGLDLDSSYGQITAKITFKNLETRTLQVTDIRYKNKPEGMNVTMNTEVVEVTIRGPRALLEQITSEDITIMVDLTAAQEGDAKYQAQVQINESFSDMVGAVGGYTVTVNAKKTD